MPYQEKRPGDQYTETRRKQRPFAMHGVDHRSRRSLHRD
jgi:hypothetical protein